MKKIVLLIGVFLTFGCSAQYDLFIKEDKYEESLNLSSEYGDTYTKDELYAQYLEEYPINIDEEFLYYAPHKKISGIEYYEKNIIDSEYGYVANYKAEFDGEDYKKSRFLNTAFQNYNIGYDDESGSYYFIAQNLNIFNYNSNLNNLNVNIILDGYEIIENNASSRFGNKLTWNFTRSATNESDRIILRYREFKNNQGELKEENTTNNKETTAEDYIIIIVSFLLFIPLLVIVILFKNKLNYRKNK